MNQLTKAAKTLAAKYNSTSLILRIAIGLVVGSVLALICPGAAWIEEFGNLFVGALKGVAPVLVFVIVASALAQGSSKLDRRFGTVVWLYMLTTFVAAALSVVTSKLFPQMLVLAEAATADVVPQGLGDVMHTLLSNIVSNPVASIMNGNYIGILMWACLFGLAIEKAGQRYHQELYGQHGGCNFYHCAVDHQPGAVWHYGPGVYQRVGQRPVHLYPVRAPVVAAGGHHAADGAGDQPVHHLYLPAPQPLPTGVPLPA